MQSIMEDSCTEPRTDSLALISASQVAEQAVEDPNDTPDPLTFVLQKLSAMFSKPQKAMVLRDIPIHVGDFGHWRNAVIKVGQEFVEAKNSWTDVGLTKEAQFEEIRYDDIVQPAIAEFHKTAARKHRATAKVEASWGEDRRTTIDSDHRSFPAKESQHFLASFARLSENTTASRMAKMIKDTINNRSNNPRRGIRLTPIITVSDLHKVEKLIRAIAASKGKAKQIMVEEVSTGIKRKHCGGNRIGSDGGHPSADTIMVQDSSSEENKTLNNAPQEPSMAKYSFKLCSCKNKSSLADKLKKSQKRGFNDAKLIFRDIEYLTPDVTRGLCWNHFRDFCAAIGLRTQVGSRSPLAYRLEEMRKVRFRLGTMRTNKNYAGWFLKTFPMGIAAGARGAGGAGGSAEGGTRNSTSKLYTADKEDADGADKGATVIDDNKLDALRFNCKEATPTFLKFNSAQVFRCFAGEDALPKWKIDGTTIAPGVMTWLF